MQLECCAQSSDGSLSIFYYFLFIEATLPSIQSEINWEKKFEKEKNCKRTKPEYWYGMIATLELKELITASEDILLMTAEKQQYTSNSTNKCLKLTGGVLLAIKQLL